MESLFQQDWAQFGMAGLFILFLIVQAFHDRKQRDRERDEHTSEVERLQNRLDEVTEMRVTELKDNQKSLFDATQVLSQAIEIVRASRG